jgi:hypothetical protein
MAHAAASPCTGNCALNIPLGLCEGCLRTREEIAAWPLMREEQRIEVLMAVERRKRESGLSVQERHGLDAGQ